MIWDKIALDPHDIRETAQRLNVDLLTATVLLRRGMNDSPSLLFLMEDALRLLHNPFHFEDMEKLIDRIRLAVERQEPVLVFGDRDVDGITSTVMMVEVLEELGARVRWLLPRGDDEYGLSLPLIEQFAAEGIRLLITVDCGISNVDEIQAAAGKGIETLVLDHHNPPETLPPALAIINPKMPQSRYPFRDIAGCTVVAKTAWALHFSHTELYDQEICLLNVRPVNEGCEIEAVKLVNLVETGRMAESFIRGLADLSRSRLKGFLSGSEVLVYDLPTQLRLLEQVLGEPAELPFVDLQERMNEMFPSTAGKSLLKIRELSRIARFQTRRFGELDMLISLFVSMVLKQDESLYAELLRFMDLVALGTLADLMPLVDENRVLVRKGLEELNRFKRPGLQALIVRQNLHGKKLSTTDVVWQITPVLNSAGRMGDPEVAARLLFTRDPSEAEKLVEELLSLNRRRKSLGDQAWDRCLNQARQSFEKSEGRFVLIIDPGLNRGITGIIAARLVGSFRTPAIAISVSGDRATGSLRSPHKMNHFLDNFADLLTNYGGHDQAAGFSLPAERVEAFSERFYQVLSRFVLPDPEEEKIQVDAELPHRYLNPDLIQVVDFFEPYGEGNRPLVFLVRGVKIESIEVMGRKEESHLKLLLSAGRHRWPAVCWKAGQRAGDFRVSDPVDIVFRLGRNYYENMESLRLTILDLKR